MTEAISLNFRERSKDNVLAKKTCKVRLYRYFRYVPAPLSLHEKFNKLDAKEGIRFPNELSRLCSQVA